MGYGDPLVSGLSTEYWILDGVLLPKLTAPLWPRQGLANTGMAFRRKHVLVFGNVATDGRQSRIISNLDHRKPDWLGFRKKPKVRPLKPPISSSVF